MNVAKLIFLLLIWLFAGNQQARAQLNPMGTQYYQNQYLGNPAVAGLEAGLNLNLGYREQWSSVPGAPVAQTLTADYGFTEKLGGGLNIYNDKAGLYSRTRLLAGFAYHLPLGEESHLSFGLSLGFMSERVSEEQIKGDASDDEISGVTVF